MNKEALKIAIGFFVLMMVIIFGTIGLVLFLDKFFSTGWVLVLFTVIMLALLAITIYHIEKDRIGEKKPKRKKSKKKGFL